MYNGIVLWFCNRRGYGFIEYEIDGVKQKDMFVYYSDLTNEGFKTIFKDQRVSFDIGKNTAGNPKAINVKVMGDKDEQ